MSSPATGYRVTPHCDSVGVVLVILALLASSGGAVAEDSVVFIKCVVAVSKRRSNNLQALYDLSRAMI